MKTMSKSLARGYFQSRSFSCGTQVAGKSLFLPTNEVQIVVQTLTHRQIAAIPKERFSAGEFGAESRGQIISAMKMADDCLANECLVL
jgi:predicted ribosome-associated RNA-binding protein Tma20